MKKSIYVFVLTLGITSCDIRDNSEVSPNDSFLRIYDTDDFSAAFTPIDVVQTTDGGYLILSGIRQNQSNFLGTHLMKVDSEGNFEEATTLDGSFLNPIDQWLVFNDRYFFITMNEFQQARLTAVELPLVIGEPQLLGATYPMHASISNGNFLLLGYNNENQNTTLYLVNPEGQTINSQSFFIGAGDDVEEPIIDHFTRTGRQLPFFTGTVADGSYFFNGFFNFTVSLVFTDLGGGGPQGVVQGQQDDGAISSAVHLSGDQFAVSRFNFGDNFYLPLTNLNTGGISSSLDLGGIPNLELVNNAPVVLKRMITENGNESLVYASNTRAGQVLVSAYDPMDGTLSGVRYFGFSNPYEVSDLIQTDDGGMAIVGTTFISGRFSRVALIKLSPEEFTNLTGIN